MAKETHVEFFKDSTYKMLSAHLGCVWLDVLESVIDAMDKNLIAGPIVADLTRSLVHTNVSRTFGKGGKVVSVRDCKNLLETTGKGGKGSSEDLPFGTLYVEPVGDKLLMVGYDDPKPPTSSPSLRLINNFDGLTAMGAVRDAKARPASRVVRLTSTCIELSAHTFLCLCRDGSWYDVCYAFNPLLADFEGAGINFGHVDFLLRDESARDLGYVKRAMGARSRRHFGLTNEGDLTIEGPTAKGGE